MYLLIGIQVSPDTEGPGINSLLSPSETWTRQPAHQALPLHGQGQGVAPHQRLLMRFNGHNSRSLAEPNTGEPALKYFSTPVPSLINP